MDEIIYSTRFMTFFKPLLSKRNFRKCSVSMFKERSEQKVCTDCPCRKKNEYLKCYITAVVWWLIFFAVSNDLNIFNHYIIS